MDELKERQKGKTALKCVLTAQSDSFFHMLFLCSRPSQMFDFYLTNCVIPRQFFIRMSTLFKAVI